MKKFLGMFVLVVGAVLVAPVHIAQGRQAATAPAATVTGKWHFVFNTEGGDRIFEPVFQQDGEQVTGKWGNGDVKGTFVDGKLTLEFPLTSDEAGPGTLKVKGQMGDDGMSGDWAFNEYNGSFKATRVKE